jgi:hypothetical protein
MNNGGMNNGGVNNGGVNNQSANGVCPGDPVNVQCFKLCLSPENLTNVQRFWQGLQQHITTGHGPVWDALVSAKIAQPQTPLEYNAFLTAICTISMNNPMEIQNFQGTGISMFEGWQGKMNEFMTNTLRDAANYLMPMGVQF